VDRYLAIKDLEFSVVAAVQNPTGASATTPTGLAATGNGMVSHLWNVEQFFPVKVELLKDANGQTTGEVWPLKPGEVVIDGDHHEMGWTTGNVGAYSRRTGGRLTFKFDYGRDLKPGQQLFLEARAMWRDVNSPRYDPDTLLINIQTVRFGVCSPNGKGNARKKNLRTVSGRRQRFRWYKNPYTGGAWNPRNTAKQNGVPEIHYTVDMLLQGTKWFQYSFGSVDPNGWIKSGLFDLDRDPLHNPDAVALLASTVYVYSNPTGDPKFPVFASTRN